MGSNPILPYLFIYYYNLLSSSEDFSSFLLFFNHCYLTYVNIFWIEWLLFLYTLYLIIFFNAKRIDFEFYYIRFILFLSLLLSFLFLSYTFNIPFCLNGADLSCNKYSLFCKISILFLLILILIISYNKFLTQPNKTSVNEIPIVFTFLLLFIFILISSYDFFIMYLCIEGISLIVYTLGSLMNESLINIEAVVKYFLVNNIASSLFLWSISYIFILVGSTDAFDVQYYILYNLEIMSNTFLYAIFFVTLVSITFKLALFPFQWWLADIFEGLWTPITLIYAIIIKATFFLLFFKLITGVFHNIIFLIQPFLFFSALGSIIFGSIGALIQVRIKRFMAYTSIAQSGYIMTGLACNSINGYVSAMLYLVMYCLITLSFFLIVLNMEHITKKTTVIYLNQLYSIFIYNKEITFHLVLILLVMAAIPPFSSFFAKLFICMVSIEAKFELIIVFLLAITLISTFYYLNFIQQLLFFKYKHMDKIYFYNSKSILNFIYLRINSFFFIFSCFMLPFFYKFMYSLIFSCAFPLSFLF